MSTIKNALFMVPLFGMNVTGWIAMFLNEENIKNTEKMYGKVIRRCVLYKGGSGIASNDIEYKNVEEFLKGIDSYS
ncbi:MAG: hypothetical protein J5857_12345 [Treponema sp.]|nr:hypothetical protein [Treponema sp.]